MRKVHWANSMVLPGDSNTSAHLSQQHKSLEPCSQACLFIEACGGPGSPRGSDKTWTQFWTLDWTGLASGLDWTAWRF